MTFDRKKWDEMIDYYEHTIENLEIPKELPIEIYSYVDELLMHIAYELRYMMQFGILSRYLLEMYHIDIQKNPDALDRKEQ